MDSRSGYSALEPGVSALDKDPRRAKIKNREALLERVEKDIRCVGIYEFGGQRRTVYEILCEHPVYARSHMEKNYD